MSLSLTVETRAWALKEPFVISRGVQTTADVVVVRLRDGDLEGLGEAAGVPYRGDTQARMLGDLETARARVEAGLTREQLLDVLPPCGARNALDAALWDLESKRSGTRAWTRAGMPRGDAITSVMTIGIRDTEAYAEAATRLAHYPWLKIKVDASDPVAAIEAVRRGAPDARLVVDSNQSWTVDQLRAVAPDMARLGVDLLEQPVSAGSDDALIDYDSPVPLCADESAETLADLPHLKGRYDFINIKLDKTGGLTAALELAHAARANGLRLMVGCMVGGSAAMAPAMVLAQICEVCDLDGPMLQAEDWPGGIVENAGVMQPPWPGLWG
ncbi:N-acetyl-D-Glu racemase DgcA [uncultured Abyssibacter sp.]|uniref:N-acetyl-D-Glu racemase DgcA n=1 Tax=uncultured Abyssibacter sp. TaxID=2320202 RepID=UPI0032B2B35F